MSEPKQYVARICERNVDLYLTTGGTWVKLKRIDSDNPLALFGTIEAAQYAARDSGELSGVFVDESTPEQRAEGVAIKPWGQWGYESFTTETDDAQ